MTETNYAVAPGEYLAEWLDDTATTQQDAARRLGCSRKQVNDLVHGRAPITADTAIKLERLTDIPADTWMRFETRYRHDLARLRDQTDLAQHVSKIPASTAKYLRQRGELTATLRAPGKLVSEFLGFHGFGTWEAFEAHFADASQGDYALAALTESKASFDAVACATWLRAGELTDGYERGRLLEFDADVLRAALPALRERAAVSDAETLSDLTEMLAQVGVVFLMVESPDRLPLYGMTRWIDRRVPVVQQSGRRGRDGFIIWTLFHELGHILNDPRGETHYEFTSEKARNQTAERRANQFALDVLFAGDGLDELRGLTSDSAIRQASRRIGVSPGVAVHQMHRRKMIPYEFGNRLLVELEWSDL